MYLIVIRNGEFSKWTLINCSVIFDFCAIVTSIVGSRLTAVKGQKINRKRVTFFFPSEVVEMDVKTVLDTSKNCFHSLFIFVRVH